MKINKNLLGCYIGEEEEILCINCNYFDKLEVCEKYRKTEGATAFYEVRFSHN